MIWALKYPCQAKAIVKPALGPDPWDNATMETFFKTIKAELIWRHIWQTRRQAEIDIFEYINGFYNPRRKHSALGWKNPLLLNK